MTTIRALQLLGDRQVALADRAAPAAPGPDEVQLRVRAVGLNHIDVWGFRGMAFAKRLYPLTVGAEASCEVAAVGAHVTNVQPGDRVLRTALQHVQLGETGQCRALDVSDAQPARGIKGGFQVRPKLRKVPRQ